MEDNKRYYWLKMDEDFFEDDTITWLEEQENGKDYVIFYLKLCLKSLKDDGHLVRYVGKKLIPYDIKALSKLTNTEPDTVAVAMRTFLEIGLVEQLETGEIYMAQIKEMIGSETDSAKRMRKKRALEDKKQKTLDVASQCANNVRGSDTSVQKSDTEIERELDKEIDKEIEKKPVPYQEIVDLYNSICLSFPRLTKLSDARKKAIKARFNTYTIDDFKKLFIMAEDSNFLKGGNDRNWSATFDWLIKDSNIAKVLDGNYKNKRGGTDGGDGGNGEKAPKFDKSKFLYNGGEV